MSGFLVDLRRAIGRRRRHMMRKPDIRWGADFITELHQRLATPPQVIFDVGAHIGATALAFADAFPRAQVHAFEPGAENLARMRSNLVGRPDIVLHNFAFGAEAGVSTLLTEPDHPSMARIGEGEGPTQEITVSTLDAFCAENDISKIDVLKIDTEGFELEVLKGAERMLTENRIGIVKLECGVDPSKEYHVPLETIMAHLYARGFLMFGIYDQWEDSLAPSPALRRVDAAFISKSHMES